MATPYKKKDKAVIPLAKGFNADKLSDYVIVMEKFDGVPLVFRKEYGQVFGTTRQGKPVTSSVKHIADSLNEVMTDGMYVIMEVFEPNSPFKVSSGHVRRDKPHPTLYGVIWDFWDTTYPDSLGRDCAFGTRMEAFTGWMHELINAGEVDPDRPYGLVPWGMVEKANIIGMANTIREHSITSEELFEGWIVRDYQSASNPNTRHWDYQKLVEEPTMDLMVVGFEEAVDKHGVGQGRVGSVLVDYHGVMTGVGPGKLSHAERKELFELSKKRQVGLEGRPNAVYYLLNFPKLATIKYKKDSTYSGIRQGTVQYFREDKEEVSYD